MSYAVPEVGTNALVIFTATGGSPVTIKNSDWTYNPMNRVKEAPNTSDGMVRAPGLFDAKGTVKGHVDTTAPIEHNVAVGTTGVLQFYRNTTKYFVVNAIIETLNITTGVDAVEDWDFAWSLWNGTVTNPV